MNMLTRRGLIAMLGAIPVGAVYRYRINLMNTWGHLPDTSNRVLEVESQDTAIVHHVRADIDDRLIDFGWFYDNNTQTAHIFAEGLTDMHFKVRDLRQLKIAVDGDYIEWRINQNVVHVEPFPQRSTVSSLPTSRHA